MKARGFAAIFSICSSSWTKDRYSSFAALTSERLTKASSCSPSTIRTGSRTLSSHQLQWRFPDRNSWVVTQPESRQQLWRRSHSWILPGSDVNFCETLSERKKQPMNFSIAERNRDICKECSSLIAAKHEEFLSIYVSHFTKTSRVPLRFIFLLEKAVNRFEQLSKWPAAIIRQQDYSSTFFLARTQTMNILKKNLEIPPVDPVSPHWLHWCYN